MTQDESKKLIKMMSALFPGMRQQNTEDMEAAYWLVLRKYGYKDVRDAVITLAGKQRLIPTASEIIELLPKPDEDSQVLDHWTRDAARKLLDCSDEKCASCPDTRTCRLKNPVGVTDSKATVTMEVT